MKRSKGMDLLLCAALVFVAGCSGKSDNEPQTSPSVSSVQERQPDSAAGSAAASPSPSEAFDPMARYDPPIEVTTVRAVSASVKFDEGQSYDSNSVYDAYERDLGIKVKNVWSVDASQYDQKVTIAIASNDIPDFMQVNALQFQQLLDADMVMDLTDVFEQYATPFTKEFMNRDGGGQLDSAVIKGNLMAIPFTDGIFNGSQFLWVRKDWLNKLQLPEPKTMQDVLAIAKAFTEQDPDGNGRKDTYGLALQKDLLGSMLAVEGFFNGYHAYPGFWIERDNQLVYGSVQPEAKAALQTLQEMYKAGQIDKEFGVKDANKAAEFLAADKIGMQFGAWWNGNSPLQTGAVKDGKLVQDWEVYPLVSIDAQPAKTQIQKATGFYFVVSKKAKNPEAVIKLLNQVIFAVESAVTEETTHYLNGKQDIETGSANQVYYVLNPTFVGSQDRFPNVGKLITKSIEAKDKTILPSGDYVLYDFYMAYLDGNLANWGYNMQLKPGGSLENMYRYMNEKLYQFNEFYGGLTPSMSEKNSILKKKENEVFTKIITGASSIDEFDSFVEQWKALGGEEITAEVNAWRQSR